MAAPLIRSARCRSASTAGCVAQRRARAAVQLLEGRAAGVALLQCRALAATLARHAIGSSANASCGVTQLRARALLHQSEARAARVALLQHSALATPFVRRARRSQTAAAERVTELGARALVLHAETAEVRAARLELRSLTAQLTGSTRRRTAAVGMARAGSRAALDGQHLAARHVTCPALRALAESCRRRARCALGSAAASTFVCARANRDAGGGRAGATDHALVAHAKRQPCRLLGALAGDQLVRGRLCRRGAVRHCAVSHHAVPGRALRRLRIG